MESGISRSETRRAVWAYLVLAQDVQSLTFKVIVVFARDISGGDWSSCCAFITDTPGFCFDAFLSTGCYNRYTVAYRKIYCYV